MHLNTAAAEKQGEVRDRKVFELFQWWNNSALVAPWADIISGVSHLKLLVENISCSQCENKFALKQLCVFSTLDPFVVKVIFLIPVEKWLFKLLPEW